MIDDFARKQLKLKQLTYLVDTLHYRLLRLLLMEKLEIHKSDSEINSFLEHFNLAKSNEYSNKRL